MVDATGTVTPSDPRVVVRADPSPARMALLAMVTDAVARAEPVAASGVTRTSCELAVEMAAIVVASGLPICTWPVAATRQLTDDPSDGVFERVAELVTVAAVEPAIGFTS
jgi:hypothetical protein